MRSVLTEKKSLVREPALWKKAHRDTNSSTNNIPQFIGYLYEQLVV